MTVGRALIFLGAVLAASGQAVLAADGPEKKAAEPNEISYYRHVRPIFQQHCQGCHQPAKQKGGYVMTRYADLLKAGDKKAAGIIPAHPDQSLVVTEITPHKGKRAAMPKGTDPLPDHEVQLIKKWIAQGATDDTPAAARQVVDAEHPPVYVRLPVITSLDYSPDGKLLAVPGYHEILLHKADGSGLAARLVGLSDRIQSVAFSPNGKWLAATGGDPGRFGEVQIWDVRRQVLKLSVPVTYDTVYGVSWSPDGSKVAFGCADNTLRAIDSRTGKQVLFQGAHNDWVLGTVFSKDGSHLVSVSRDRSMKLVEVATQRFVDNITSITPGALKGGLMAVARHPTKDELLIGGADGVPKIYQMHRDKKRVIGDDFNLLRKFDGLPGRIFSVRYSPDGSRIAVGSSLNGQGQVRVYRSGSDKPDDRLVGMCALPVVARRGLVPLFLLSDFRVGQLAAECQAQQGAVYALAYRPDGKAVASAGFDGVVRLNDPQTGKLLKEFVPVPLKTGGSVTRRK
ncbi:MAG TPA: c-type cytochrome domain-containing protein [Gemmataceae bacterium]|nr:c-type cytochrome domain-containing protein [Gemmataceae bacterium]